MKAGFKAVDRRFEQVDKRFEQVDKRFEQVDKHFDALEYRLTTLEGKFSTFEEKFDDLSVVVFGHEHRMTEFLTRDEFNIFKSENAAAHDRTAQALERIEQEIKAFQRSQERLEKRVDIHEVVLVKNGLMAA